MPITIFRPSGDGPHPLVVVNHGRNSAARAEMARWRPEHMARYLVAKGFVVMAPTRVGYGETAGDFDPESSGTCSRMRVEPLSIAASDQVLATVEFAKTLPYVDASRWLVAGSSVGGLAAVATVGRNPAGLVGGINFAGGIGAGPNVPPGKPCGAAEIERYWNALAKTAVAPMVWLYWRNDQSWGERHPVQWHKAWVQGGGKADFVVMPSVGSDGHGGMVADMESWLPVVDGFLSGLGFKQPAIVPRPASSGFARVDEVERVPLRPHGRQTGYAKFLEIKHPRAFAIGEGGAFGWATGDYAHGRALGFCQRSGQSCKLYAVDDEVVWLGR